MSSNSFGVLFRMTTFGESHGPAMGAIVDGVPAGLPLTEERIQKDLDLRRPGTGRFSSTREEPDAVRILSGVFEGKTTGAPLALLIENRDARPEDYLEAKDLYRPGHADFTWEKKFGLRDWRGGGRASGRETVARVAAGAVARLILEIAGIKVAGATREIAGIQADLSSADWGKSTSSPLRCPDAEAAARMTAAILEAEEAGDSVGGVVEVRAAGVMAGLGEPVFNKLEARLGSALLSIGAVKGIEIGAGFSLARMRGSQSNDAMEPSGGFSSNHAGGILGGISTGEEIVVRAAVKPTPSIRIPQNTVDKHGAPITIRVNGRHDPCLVPRIVPVAEAMVCLVLADALLIDRSRQGFVAQGRREP